MNIVEKRLDEIRPYANNPRKNDEAVEAVANSIREFGWKQPIVVDTDGVIIVGHTRYKAAQMLGLETVPVLVADDLSDDKVKAYRLADNKTNELAEWDLSALEMELGHINMDMEQFGFVYNIDNITENPYTGKVNIPQYEPSGDEPPIDTLVDKQKTESLIDEINESNLTEEEKEFLRLAAYRHLAFNYKKVADYYAIANNEMQELMEKSALVIIDYEDAIANGYARLNDDIKEMFDDVEK